VSNPLDSAGAIFADRRAALKVRARGRLPWSKLTLERIANRWPNKDIEALMPWNFNPAE